MGLYDYKNYSNAEAIKRAALAKDLAEYGAVPTIVGVHPSKLIDVAEALIGKGVVNSGDIDLGLPSGWREVGVRELGLDPRLEDGLGYIKFMSPLTGWTTTGPQLKVLAQTDAGGHVTGLSVVFAPTNSPVDVIDFLQLNKDALVPSMVPVLTAVRDMAVANGLDGEDVTVTGYSLGGGMTNLMSRHADTLVGGFFAKSDYYGFAAPVIHDSDRIINIGHENDVVHRATGTAKSFWEAVAQADPLLSNNDNDYGSSVDNFVLFDTAYAGADVVLAVDSILNPFAWWAHLGGVITDGMQRAGNSAFYEFMDQDSTVVVTGLNALLRGSVWVRDKAAPTSDHFGSPGFIIGSQYNDLLGDGASNDWMEGLGGNDTIRVSGGSNLVDGGAGKDTLRLTQDVGSYSVYRLGNGEVAFASADGLTIARNVEQVEFTAKALFGLTETQKPFTIMADRLEDDHWSPFELGDKDIRYAGAVSGTDAANSLSGAVVFGLGGNDAITGTAGNDLLHGGKGADVLTGGAGNDRLYGAEHADRLIGGSGNNWLNGGHGNDVFVFNASDAGRTVIEDFDAQSGDLDHLQLLGGNGSAALAAARVESGDLVIRFGQHTIVLDGVTSIDQHWLA